MTMRSLEFLPALDQLPTDPSATGLDSQATVERLRRMDKDQFASGVSIGSEQALESLSLLDAGGMSDDLVEAYQLNHPSAEQSITEYYTEMMNRGPQSVTGFISNLKGKVGEIESERILEERFPGYDFTIAPDPTQAVWDLNGVGPDGAENILVQVKMGAAGYAYDVADRMESDPDVLFAVSREIYGKLAEDPQLSSRLIDTGVEVTQLTAEVKEGLEALSENMGIDVAGSLTEALPYVAEVAMGIRLIWNVVSAERNLADEELSDRARVHGIRTLTLMSRFGVNQVCTWAGTLAGGVAGTAVVPGAGSGVGSLAGAFAGAGGGMLLNRMLQPRMDEIAMKLVGGDSDDLFYLMNKQAVDGIGSSLAATSVGHGRAGGQLLQLAEL